MPKEKSDLVLLREIELSEHAGDQLCTRYRLKILSYLLWYTNNGGFSEDVTQDVLTKLCDREFRSWLIKGASRYGSILNGLLISARNLCLDRLRKVRIEEKCKEEIRTIVMDKVYEPDLFSFPTHESVEKFYEGLSEEDKKLIKIQEENPDLRLKDLPEKLGLTLSVINHRLREIRKACVRHVKRDCGVVLSERYDVPALFIFGGMGSVFSEIEASESFLPRIQKALQNEIAKSRSGYPSNTQEIAKHSSGRKIRLWTLAICIVVSIPVIAFLLDLFSLPSEDLALPENSVITNSVEDAPLLKNMEFSENLDNWVLNQFTAPLGTWSIEWLEENEGSCLIALDGRPAGAGITQKTQSMISLGDTIVVYFSSDNCFSSGCTLFVDNVVAAKTRYLKDSPIEGQLVWHADKEYSAGTLFELRASVWPGSSNFIFRKIEHIKASKILNDAIPEFIDIAVGKNHSLAVGIDGYVYSWGNNQFGELGHGDKNVRTKPTRLKSLLLKNIETVYAGNGFSYAISCAGITYSWGRNNFGQLGLGDISEHLLPEKVILPDEIYNVKKISIGGNHVIAVLGNGNVYTWGCNLHGQLGLGDTVDRLEPSIVEPLANVGVIMIAAGGDHTIVLAQGAVATFGCGTSGQLGLGDFKDHLKPTLVDFSFESIVTSIAAGEKHSLALVDGSVYSWGEGKMGQLGIGNLNRSSLPIQVPKLPLGDIEGIFTGKNFSGCISSFGELIMWGDNSSGQFGFGDSESKIEPVNAEGMLEGEVVHLISSASSNHVFVFLHNGRIVCCGANKYGQLGIGEEEHIVNYFRKLPIGGNLLRLIKEK